MSGEQPMPRLVSLDQFRGYTVAGMLLVNFLGNYSACPPILRHHNDYCSYADTIMPGFLFCVGFALRLTFGRRLISSGAAAAYGRVAWRLLGLLLVACIVYTPGSLVNSWAQLQELGWWGVIQAPLKREWFQALTHIAVTSLWLLPVLRATRSSLIGWAVFSGLLHVVLSHLFYFSWIHQDPVGIDGGPLGFLTWSIPAIVGAVMADVMAQSGGRPRLSGPSWAAVGLMACGWLLSWPTRCYDTPAARSPFAATTVSAASSAATVSSESSAATVSSESSAATVSSESSAATVSSESSAATAAASPPGGAAGDPSGTANPLGDAAVAVSTPVPKLAASPVWPTAEQRARYRERWQRGAWSEVRAEWPGWPPPREIDAERGWARQWNYWMMSQRAGTLSYLVFSAGFSLGLYLLFHVVVDRSGYRWGPLTTFGTNALAAYVLHDWVNHAVSSFTPSDAPLWYVGAACGLYGVICYLLIRSLERRGIYLRT